MNDSVCISESMRIVVSMIECHTNTHTHTRMHTLTETDRQTEGDRNRETERRGGEYCMGHGGW